MSILKIAQVGQPVLRQEARELSIEELKSSAVQHFIDDLIETMRDANGAGLAANQVHHPIAICCIEVQDNPRYPYKPKIPLTVLVNPKIEVIGDETFSNFEGCLSVPNLRGRVKRAMKIRVRGWDRHGEVIDQEVQGITAGTYQHEVDHLRGRLFLDSVYDPTSFCTWEEFRRYYEAEFAAQVQEIVKRVGS